MVLTLREKFIVLINNDILKKADALVLLEGDGLYRVKRCVELFNLGYGDQIIFSGDAYKPEYGSYPAEYIIPELIKYGIPVSSIIIENKSKNTREQAEEVLKIVTDRGWKRIILIASNYHQYRAYLTFLKVILEKELKLELINGSANELPWFQKVDWGTRYDLLESEFLKIEEYGEKGHIASYKEAIEYQQWKEKQN